MTSPLVAVIKTATSPQSSSTGEKSDSPPSERWLRIKNLIIRPEIQSVEIHDGQGGPGNLLRQFHVTFESGTKIRLSLGDPTTVEQALESVLNGFSDTSFFNYVAVE